MVRRSAMFVAGGFSRCRCFPACSAARASCTWSATADSTAMMEFDLSTANNSSDKLVLSGAFDKGLAGAFRFDFNGGGLEGQTYTLVQFASTTFSASDFTFVDLAPGLHATFEMTGTSLNLAVVPEPGSAIALALGGALLGMRRRRRA